jgi:uncharacterized protein (TIGR03437 family)
MVALPWWRLALLLALAPALSGHAPPTYIPVPPLHTKANLLVDSTNQAFLLRGVEMPGLEVANPGQADLDAQRAMTAFTFRIIQQRWNMNAVRLPVSAAVWRRDGKAYLDQLATIVAAANQENLVVVLAVYGDARSGAAADTGLPNSDVTAFWMACATLFKNTPGVVFALYNEPSARSIPGATPGMHRANEWRVWLNGGALSGGQTAVGMQGLADAIRATGAQQIIAAPAFHDSLDFQGFGPEFYIRDANVMYEAHPFFDHGTTEDEWNANFGFVAGSFPVYAGAWGMPFGHAGSACTSIPIDVPSATDLMYRTVAYFDRRSISWTVADFRPGSLIQNFTDYAATRLNLPWTCDAANDPVNGIGQFILLWMTGDPAGFGSLDLNQIASAAGGPVAPVAPGQIISIYGQLIGPAVPLGAQLDASGQVTRLLGDTQVFFDGVAAPIFVAGAFQVNVQVPYEVAGRAASAVQLVYHGIPSNIIQLPLVDAAPGILTPLAATDAAALNQDGTLNNSINSAPRGSILTIFATGCGQTLPASATGVPAQPLLNRPALPVTLAIGGRPAEIVFAGAAPGLVGVMQVNARIPMDVPVASVPERASLILTIDGHQSRFGITFWVK